MKALYDLAAPAKLNLFLHIIGQRADGYHLLQSIFVLIDWCDRLHLEKRGDARLVRHDLSTELPAEDLCLRAARKLQEASGCTLGVDIHIDKQVPSGAGMGGGSSDAATVLLGLNQLWGLHWPLERLLPVGLALGADVPFFLHGRNAFVEGIGEVITPIVLTPMVFAVLKPPVSIPTAQLFSSKLLTRDTKPVILAGFPADNSVISDFGKNDLQLAAEAHSDQVTQALQILAKPYGNARMTGSGSAVFARLNSGKFEPSARMSSATNSLPDCKIEAGWTGRICRSLEQHPLVGFCS